MADRPPASFAPRCGCGLLAEVVGGDALYPSRADLREVWFWRCRPCRKHVGTHRATGRPLGALAGPEERALRSRVHAIFDPLWKRADGRERPAPMKRGEAYAMLRAVTGIPAEEVHVSMFDAQRCRAVLDVLAFFQPVPFLPVDDGDAPP